MTEQTTRALPKPTTVAEVQVSEIGAHPEALASVCARHGMRTDPLRSDLPADIQHLISPVVGMLRMDKDGNPYIVERLALALALARRTDEAQYDVLGGSGSTTGATVQWGVEIAPGYVNGPKASRDEAVRIVGTSDTMHVAVRTVNPWTRDDAATPADDVDAMDLDAARTEVRRLRTLLAARNA